MMRVILRILLMGGLSWGALQFLPFWSIAIAGLLVGLLLSHTQKRRAYGKKKKKDFSFLAGFIAIFLLWGGFAWYADIGNASVMSEKIGRIFLEDRFSSQMTSWAMIGITALMGGILGGLSLWSGNLLGKAIRG